MTRFTETCTAAISIVFVAGAAHAAAPDIDGVWSRDDGTARVRIEACDGSLCATNIWIKDGDSDEKVGDVLVMTVKPTDDGALAGEAFDRRRDRHYSMDIDVKGSRMTTKGCIVGGIICKSTDWTRGG